MGRQAQRQWVALSLLRLASLVSCSECKCFQIVETETNCKGVNCNQDRTITRADHLDFGTCSTLGADLTIKSITPTFTTDGPPPTLTLQNLVKVEGDLIFEDITASSGAAVTPVYAISAPSVTAVAGKLSFSNLEDVLVPSFPDLATVGSSLVFSGVTFKAPKFQGTGDSAIGDFARLTSVGGALEFTRTSVSQIGTSFNGDVSSINFASLGTVRGLLRLLGNQNLTSLTLPITDVATVNILENLKLRTVSLTDVDKVHQDIYITGILNQISLDSLKSNGVEGTVNIDAGSGSFKCKSIDLPSSIYNCPAESVGATGTGNPSSSQSSTSGGGGLNSGAQIGIGVGVGVGGALLLGALVFFFLRRRKSKQRLRSAPAGDYTKAEQVSPHDERPRSDYYNNSPYGFAAGRHAHDPPSEKADSPDTAPPEPWAHQQSPVLDRLEQNYRDVPRDDYRDVPSHGHQAGMEEHQGVNHEMDARSLPDLDGDDDDEADTRSLEDIERIHQGSR